MSWVDRVVRFQPRHRPHPDGIPSLVGEDGVSPVELQGPQGETRLCPGKNGPLPRIENQNVARSLLGVAPLVGHRHPDAIQAAGRRLVPLSDESPVPDCQPVSRDGGPPDEIPPRTPEAPADRRSIRFHRTEVRHRDPGKPGCRSTSVADHETDAGALVLLDSDQAGRCLKLGNPPTFALPAAAHHPDGQGNKYGRVDTDSHVLLRGHLVCLRPELTQGVKPNAMPSFSAVPWRCYQS